MKSFNPTPRNLMGPGPSNVHPRILSAIARPTIGHLDPDFITMMEETKHLLQYAFQTKNALTMPVSAPGSAGMETCFVNLVEPGDTVVVCINGVFGTRMKENVERIGGKCVVVQDPWGEAVSPQKLEDTLKAHPEAKIVAFVHAETSTGAQSDAHTLCKIAQQYDCLTIVDAVTSLGGSPLKMDEWGINALYSGSQKCLSCVPGLSPISFDAQALERVKNRSTKVQSWFLDLNLVTAYWGEGAQSASTPRAYHHTAPVNTLYALHEALLMLKEEGLEAAWQRHADMHQLLKQKLSTLGIDFVVPEDQRLPQLNSVWIPKGVDDVATRKRLLQDYNLEIGAGLADFAGKVWRIGLMGHTAQEQNVLFCAAALGSVLG